MQYIAVKWLHDGAEEPVLLFHELDDEGWEVRKVEVFRDGVAHFADSNQQSGPTELGLLPVPPFEQIAADPEFDLREITQDEFEKVWQDALHRRKFSL